MGKPTLGIQGKREMFSRYTSHSEEKRAICQGNLLSVKIQTFGVKVPISYRGLKFSQPLDSQ